MKKLGFGLLGLFGLLVAAVAIGPSFVDWNAHKGRIASEARKFTGRDLVIDGDVSLTLLPAPALSVAGVKLANISGGSDPTMVALESLKVRIAFLPLLQLAVKVESIELIKPTILLEVLPDGRRNWEISPAAEAAPSPAGDRSESGDLPEAVRLDSITINDGTLIYRDALSGRDERIDQVNLEIAAQTLQGPFALSGSAVARGLAGEFEIGLGRLVDDGATSFKLRAGLLDGAATVRFGGAISVHPEGTSLRGRISADGDDLATLVRGFTGNPRSASALAMPFSLAAELSADSQSISATGLALRLGDSALDGAIQLSFGPPADARITLSATRLDLDALLAQDATGGAPAPSTEGTGMTTGATGGAAGGATSSADKVLLPQDVTGSMDLAVEALAYRGQVVRQIRLSVALAQGRIKITRALALLPGGSDISVSGTLWPEADGQAEHRFEGRFEAASDNLRAVLDWLGAEVAAVPADRLRRMSVSALVGATPGQVTVSEIDLRLDVSRVTGGVVVALRERPGLGIGLAVDKIDLDAYFPAAAKETTAAGPVTGGASARPNAPTPFDAFDANLDLKFGRLTLAGMTARDLRLDAVLRQGALTLRDAQIGDLAGSSLRASGTITDLTGQMKIDGKLKLKIPNPARLAKAAKLDLQLPSGIGALDLAGSLKGSAERVAFDLDIGALGGRLGLAGAVQPQAAPLEFDMTVAAKHASLAKLLSKLGAPAPAGAKLGGLDLSGRLAGTPLGLGLTDLNGKAGPIDLSGSIDADLSGPKPVIRVTLATGEFPVTALLAPAAAKGGSNSATGAGGARPNPKAAGALWSRAPIDLAALNQINGEVKLRSKALILGEARLDKAEIEASLSDGVLDLRKISGEFYGGALSATGKADLRQEPRADLAVTLIEMDLARLLHDVAKSDRVSGPLTLDWSLSSRGKSEADLVSALSGKGTVSGTLQVKAKQEEKLGAALLGILGEKIKEIRGVTDATNVLFNAFAGAPAPVKGSFTVERGVVRTSDTEIMGHQATAVTSGLADLVKWRLDTRTEVYRKADPKTAYLTVLLQGPLDQPNTRISGEAFRRQSQSAPSPTARQPSPLTLESQKITPEDLIRKGLKGLLQGFGN